ncbi:MAG: DUF4430 domain-containing protein [Terrisporobacter othiniensis]|uniref:DUF4430 domain-containing protein n=1 Tax=Terrisporobacter othiniensis TaxID=1577792 RepID=UPI00290B579A|nr:DUF4430 domain-containing protein [Terrisporobacter othiniensis]MDU6985315.1 DUF4430 domain-containing protein [Terrisporobacter othiniensis]
MNKKITVTLVAVIVLLLGAFGIKSINNKNVQDGEKTITIEVLSEADNINKKEEIKTSEEKLGAVISNKEGYEIKSDGMLVKVENIDLSKSTNEYWHVSVNGEDAQVGVNDQVINDGDTIKFERIKFK